MAAKYVIDLSLQGSKHNLCRKFRLGVAQKQNALTHGHNVLCPGVQSFLIAEQIET